MCIRDSYKRGDVVVWKPSGKVKRWYLNDDGECQCAIINGPYVYEGRATTYKILVMNVTDKHGASYQLWARADDLRPGFGVVKDLPAYLNSQRSSAKKGANDKSKTSDVD